jgi:hypothetical protein
MEYLVFIDIHHIRIKLIFIFVIFFTNGYSIPLDTVKRQNCPEGLSLQINGKQQCIDTTIRFHPHSIYYHPPEYWFESDEEDYYLEMISVNLQILEESKWYNEDIQEDRFRIFLMRCAPGYDSIVLYSFFKQNHDSIKLIKKEMPVFYTPHCFLPDSDYFRIDSKSYRPAYDYVLPDSTCYYKNKDTLYIVHYKQTEFIIHKKGMQKLVKQIDRLKECEIFDRYGNAINFVIEYLYKGNYYLLMANEPWQWCKRFPLCRQLDKKCPANSGYKVTKWLKKY